MPAVKMSTPTGEPPKIPSRPSGVDWIQGSMWLPISGTTTKMPHMPKMMLGIAASISIPVPTTRETSGCTSSTSSREMASASGTAMSMARIVVTKVPYRLDSAPYWLVPGL